MGDQSASPTDAASPNQDIDIERTADNNPVPVSAPAPIAATATTTTANQPDLNTTPIFSVFTHREKIFIIIVAGTAGLFSPLSAQIYLPALNTLAEYYNVSNSLINLTVTSYLILQGLAPTFVGSLSDVYGRKPAYVVCFTIYMCANIGLALQNNYAALVVLRCLQSAGSSGTISLAMAVISDIVTSAERGSYAGYVSMGTVIGPSIGPLIGGLLTTYLGWRSIFWFLTIFSGVEITFLILVMPETCRAVVGDGSVLKKGILYMSLMTYMKRRKAGSLGRTSSNDTVPAAPLPKATKKLRTVIFGSFLMLFSRTNVIPLFTSAIFFAGFYLILTVIPSALSNHYHYNTLQVSLCYLPIGVGTFISSFVTGRVFLDRNFRRHAKKEGIELSKNRQKDLIDFPIERARLEIAAILISLAACIVLAFGWVIQERTNVSGPIILLFFAGLTLSGSFQCISALLVDMNRSRAGAVTGAMNLTRCLIGAGGVAALDPMLDGLGGMGWLSVLIAAVYIALTGLLFIHMKVGWRWRREDRAKQEEKARRKEKEKGDKKEKEQQSKRDAEKNAT